MESDSGNSGDAHVTQKPQPTIAMAKRKQRNDEVDAEKASSTLKRQKVDSPSSKTPEGSSSTAARQNPGRVGRSLASTSIQGAVGVAHDNDDEDMDYVPENDLMDIDEQEADAFEFDEEDFEDVEVEEDVEEDSDKGNGGKKKRAECIRWTREQLQVLVDKKLEGTLNKDEHADPAKQLQKHPLLKGRTLIAIKLKAWAVWRKMDMRGEGPRRTRWTGTGGKFRSPEEDAAILVYKGQGLTAEQIANKLLGTTAFQGRDLGSIVNHVYLALREGPVAVPDFNPLVKGADWTMAEWRALRRVRAKFDSDTSAAIHLMNTPLFAGKRTLRSMQGHIAIVGNMTDAQWDQFNASGGEEEPVIGDGEEDDQDMGDTKPQGKNVFWSLEDQVAIYIAIPSQRGRGTQKAMIDHLHKTRFSNLKRKVVAMKVESLWPKRLVTRFTNDDNKILLDAVRANAAGKKLKSKALGKQLHQSTFKERFTEDSIVEKVRTISKNVLETHDKMTLTKRQKDPEAWEKQQEREKAVKVKLASMKPHPKGHFPITATVNELCQMDVFKDESKDKVKNLLNRVKAAVDLENNVDEPTEAKDADPYHWTEEEDAAITEALKAERLALKPRSHPAIAESLVDVDPFKGRTYIALMVRLGRIRARTAAVPDHEQAGGDWCRIEDQVVEMALNNRSVNNVFKIAKEALKSGLLDHRSVEEVKMRVIHVEAQASSDLTEEEKLAVRAICEKYPEAPLLELAERMTDHPATSAHWSISANSRKILDIRPDTRVSSTAKRCLLRKPFIAEEDRLIEEEAKESEDGSIAEVAEKLAEMRYFRERQRSVGLLCSRIQLLVSENFLEGIDLLLGSILDKGAELFTSKGRLTSLLPAGVVANFESAERIHTLLDAAHCFHRKNTTYLALKDGDLVQRCKEVPSWVHHFASWHRNGRYHIMQEIQSTHASCPEFLAEYSKTPSGIREFVTDMIRNGTGPLELSINDRKEKGLFDTLILQFHDLVCLEATYLDMGPHPSFFTQRRLEEYRHRLSIAGKRRYPELTPEIIDFWFEEGLYVVMCTYYDSCS
ncbi:hypothetical protein BKA70DRAFT_1566903 [Coprinopsis sp. MPI-PUGE-AT-0042]|nr:hypothetical protein BKA70DRAFT_1566903 [Coprinopsis sp. MPI-PUGE-AT-0042]